MKQTKLWLTTIATLLCSLTASAETFTFADWTSTNKMHSSTGSKTYMFIAGEGATLSFSWSVSSEAYFDELIVTLDGTTILEKSGSLSGTYNNTISKGSHTLVVKYTKNSFGSSGTDQASVSNIVITGVSNVIDGLMYFTSDTTASVYRAIDTVAIAIPSSVTIDSNVYVVNAIGNNAFEGCRSLTAITLPEGVTSIGNYAFEGCSSLTSIIIPEGVTRIGESAFYGCTSLKEVIFEDGSEALTLGYNDYSSSGTTGEGLFYDCPLEKVYLGRNLSYNSGQSYGYSPFYGKDALTNVTIGDSVTSIGEWAFYDCSSLTAITLPEGVTSIGGGAFSGCSSLTSITIPESVTSIGSSAFSYCRSLTSITLPEGVTSIGYRVFEGCSSLTSITLSEGVTSIVSYAFSGCRSLTSITIPEGVTSIGDNAFNGCTSLKEIIFEDGSETLRLRYNYYSSSGTGEGLFYDCPLENVYLGRNLSYNSGQSCGYSPFYGKDALTNVTIGNEVTEIGQYAFRDCDNIHSLTIPNGVLSIGSSAFSTPDKVIWLTNTPPTGYVNAKGSINYVANDQYTSLSNVKVYPYLSSMFEVGGVKYVPVSPSERTCHAIDCAYDSTATIINVAETASFKGVAMKVTEVMPYTFYGNDHIKEVSVSHLGDIGDYVFYGCDSIQSVVVSNQGDICSKAFYDCDGIKSVDIRNQGSIGYQAFYGCNGMETANVTNKGAVGNEAFSGCSSLKTVTLGDSIGSLGDKAFYQCTSLQEIVIPDSVKSVGSYCFSGCSAIKSAVTGNGLTNIKEYTFENCTSLADVTVGDGVTTISSYAFTGCSALTNVALGRSITTINSYALQNCSSLTEITLPQAMTKVGDYVFSGCSKLADVVIADRTTALALGSNGSSALFADCPLDSVYIGGKITYNTTSDKGYSPFYRNTSLRTVVITDREEQIYDNEFYGCTNLKNVAIGNGVKSIGDYAFSGCSSLYGFSFGSNMESIGAEAFSDCTSLTSITSHAAVPPICGTQALDDINKWNCVLGVPLGNADAYYAADQWKEFFFIEDVVEVGHYVLTYVVDGEVVHTEVLKHKDAVTMLVEPTKVGYTFSGWDKTLTTMPAEDVTISGTFTMLPIKDCIIHDIEGTFAVEENRDCETITYIRIFDNTNWQALYVPFEIPVTEDFLEDFDIADLNDVRQYDRDNDGVKDETVIEAFKVTSGTLAANYPYLIRAKEVGEKVIVVTDATLYATEENSYDCSSLHEMYTFTGTYSASDQFPQGEGYYTLLNGEWQPVVENTTLGAFRFYLKVDSRDNGEIVAKTIRMRIVDEDEGEDDGTTGMEQWTIDNGQLTIYDLQGRKVTDTENLKGGVYIINGCKVVIGD